MRPSREEIRDAWRFSVDAFRDAAPVADVGCGRGEFLPPVGMIDFDEAGPGARLDDLGYAVWKHLNLGLVDLPASKQGRRTRLMAAAYGVPADARLLASIERAQERVQRVIERAPAGDNRRAGLAQHRDERAWLRANASFLAGG